MKDPVWLDAVNWDSHCLKWRGRVLTGKYAHICWNWDGLPVDETTPEWPCACRFDHESFDKAKDE